jgi:hypothetical protein
MYNSSCIESKFFIYLNSDQNPVIAIVSYQIVKTKFTDAAFTRHILNFLIKD